MLANLVSILAFAIIALAAYGLGRLVFDRLRVEFEERWFVVFWSLAVGLVLWAVAFALLRSVGLFRPIVVVPLTLCVGLYGAARILLELAALRKSSPELSPTSASHVPRWLACSGVTLAAISCLTSLAAALAPPTAAEACPHLETAKSVLADGESIAASSSPADLPRLAHYWYAWGMLVDGPVAAQLIHWGLGVLLALATVVLARPIVGAGWAWLAAGVVVLVPLAHAEMAVPSSGIPLALATTLSLSAWWRGMIEGESDAWLAIAGLMAGAGLGTSLLAAVFLLAQAASMGWLWMYQPKRRELLARGLAVVLVVAVIVGAPWTRVAEHRSADAAGLAESVGPSVNDSASYELGAIFPAALPGVLIARRLRGLGMLLAMALLYATGWHWLRGEASLLLPIVPPLAIAAVWVWMELARFPAVPRLMAAAAMAALAVLSTVAAIHRCREYLPAACGWEERGVYLARHDPTWRAAEVSNQIFTPESRMLSEERSVFHFACQTVHEGEFERQWPTCERLRENSRLVPILREAGITHLLLVDDEARPAEEQSLSSRLRRECADGGQDMIPLIDYTATLENGQSKRYRLVILRNQAG